MVFRIAFLALVGLVLAVGSAPAQESGNEKAAASAAEKWLSMVDNEQYADSWKESAEYFRNAVNQKQWEQSMQSVRKPLGRLLSRKVKSAMYMTSLPGAPVLVVAHAPKEDLMGQSSSTIALSYLDLAATGMELGACWAGYFNAAVSTFPPMSRVSLETSRQWTAWTLCSAWTTTACGATAS